MTRTADKEQAKAQRNEWDRILRRVSRDLGLVVSEEYLYGLTLETAGPPGRVQLDCCGDTAHIEVAYRPSGPAALEVMELAYRIEPLDQRRPGRLAHPATARYERALSRFPAFRPG